MVCYSDHRQGKVWAIRFEGILQAFHDMVEGYSNYHGIKIDYVFIPEQHTDGAWHLHGFMKGIPTQHMRNFTLDEKLPYRLRERLLQGIPVFEWMPYKERFGFTEIERIQNQRGAAWYIQKYITKDLTRVVQEFNAHLYYCTKGLSRPIEMARGWTVPIDQLQSDYSTEYASVRWVSGKNSDDMAYFNELLSQIHHSKKQPLCTST